MGKYDLAANAFERSIKIKPSLTPLSNLGTVYFAPGTLFPMLSSDLLKPLDSPEMTISSGAISAMPTDISPSRRIMPEKRT